MQFKAHIPYALAGLYGFGHEIVYMFLEKFS